MKKFVISLFVLLSMLVCTTPSYATDGVNDLMVTVNLKDLPADVASEILKHKKNNDAKGLVGSVTSVDDVKRYTEIGRAIAMALKEACTVLSVEVNQFVTTPVGKITTALIIYRVAGKDIIQAVIFAFFSLFLYILIITSFVLFFRTQKIAVKRTKDGKTTEETIEYVPKYNFKSDEARATCVGLHIIGFIALTVVVLACLI